MEQDTVYIETSTLEKISQGDEQAFRTVFDAYRNKIYYFLQALLDNQAAAEEITQEVFVRIWTSREKLTEVTNFNAYVFVVARNRALDYIRATASERTMKSEWLRRSHLQANYTEEDIDLKESKKLIEQAVALLPQQQARVFRLNKEHRLKRHEIARELNISENTVRNHLAKAVKFIQDYLDEHGGDAALLLLLWYIV